MTECGGVSLQAAALLFIGIPLGILAAVAFAWKLWDWVAFWKDSTLRVEKRDKPLNFGTVGFLFAAAALVILCIGAVSLAVSKL